MLASGDKQGIICIWKVKDGKCLRKFEVQLSKEIAAVT